ncbi:MAG TPA: hypothetical protein VHA74_03900 [Candidatus Dojkabacteria bacterium]|nr:hypothetical protein [Candidatus Dojkabacteria bacterium]
MNKRDADKRVYIKLPIVNTEIITRLQKYLKDNIHEEVVPISKDKLHMTLFHYGKAQELYEEIKKLNSDLDFDNFLTGFYNLLLTHSDIKRKLNIIIKGAELGISNIRPMSDSLDIFGDINEPVIVLRLKRPAELLEYREEIFKQFKEFLKDCGVKNIKKFMKVSPNLKYQVDYNPHVSLGFAHTMDIQLPKIDVSDIQILLGGLEVVD